MKEDFSLLQMFNILIIINKKKTRREMSNDVCWCCGRFGSVVAVVAHKHQHTKSGVRSKSRFDSSED